MISSRSTALNEPGHPRMTNFCNAPWLRSALAAVACLAALCPNAFALDFKISPAKVTFERNFEQAQLLVTATDTAGATSERSEDLTSKATFATSNAAVASVSPTGRLLGVGNGDGLRVERVELELVRERVDAQLVKTRRLLEGRPEGEPLGAEACERLKALGYIVPGCS